MKIVVLGGGVSSERQVSLVTSMSVCKALRSLGHKAIFVDSFYGIEKHTGCLADLFEVEDGFCQDNQVGRDIPCIEDLLKNTQRKSKLGKNVLDICDLADCVFLGFHGMDGEDGRIQAMFDLLQIPYTGSGMLGSALGMDKYYTKQIMNNNNIPTAPLVNQAPCVVKEINGGSSIGTWICNTNEEMEYAISKVSNEYIIEKKICGREFTVPVLGDEALDVIEIIAPNGKFDYISKYQRGNEGANEICPALITDEQKKMLQKLAVRLHKALGLEVYSRSDFIVDDDGKAWCLEVNTLPGMTPTSLFPKAAKLAGLDYANLCEKIIELSMIRYQRK